jgi:hypothetical protein
MEELVMRRANPAPVALLGLGLLSLGSTPRRTH